MAKKYMFSISPVISKKQFQIIIRYLFIFVSQEMFKILNISIDKGDWEADTPYKSVGTGN